MAQNFTRATYGLFFALISFAMEKYSVIPMLGKHSHKWDKAKL
jgi:hypothetical protein